MGSKGKRSPNLPNLLRWPGGKSRMRGLILGIMPEHCTYVEPFAGGASIFFAKQPSRKEVINDLSKPLVNFYKGTAKGALRKCSYTHSRKTFEKILAKNRRGQKLTPCEYFTLNKISFAGRMQTWADDDKAQGVKNPKAKKVFERLDEFESRLRHAKIRNEDFAKVMRENDSPCAFHFVDPPYEFAVSKSSLKGMYNASASPKRVLDVSKKMKGRVLITYGDHPEIRKLFCTKRSGFECQTRTMGYSLASHDGKTNWKQGHELIITNFDPKTGKRYGRGRK